MNIGAEFQSKRPPEDEPSGGGGGLVRLKITGALAGLGALGGAVSGVVLTFFGNIVSGYPVAPGIDVYAWNVGIMAGLGAVFGPALAWTALRRVPLWRSLLEPAVAGILTSVAAMLFAPPLFPFLVPAAIFASAGRLAYVYRDQSGRPSTPEPGIEADHLRRAITAGEDPASD